MEIIDYANSDELIYEYNPDKGFDYHQFLKDILDIAPDYLETERVGADGEVFPLPRLEDTDEAFENMFHRMGVDKLDGKKNFLFIKPMTYIHAVITCEERSGRKYDTLIQDVSGVLVLIPRNIEIIS